MSWRSTSQPSPVPTRRRTLHHRAQRLVRVEVADAERVRVGEDRVGGVAVDLGAVVVGERPASGSQPLCS